MNRNTRVNLFGQTRLILPETHTGPEKQNMK